MPSLAVLRQIANELLTTERAQRFTEPDLVMESAEQVAAYTRAGREDGVMAPVYLYNASHVLEIIKPGDKVLDLACGPATQLALVARMAPECSFTGVDLSREMLARAQAHVEDQKLANVGFIHSSIAQLASIEDQSIDAVMSTMALHHLPELATLEATFKEINRVLKPGGGIYLADFGHLKSERSIRYFAYQYADRQPEIFTVDYLNSLRAAFSLSDFRKAGEQIQGRAQVYSTFMVPYMVALKSARRQATTPELESRLRAVWQEMPSNHKRDFADLKTFFLLGGLRSKLI
ncbi:methyltransferase domain-containing protein [Uliginosibacterium sp. H3]|uniref:Methyltransferase domain-containing protein n=1 Tax=Uliginosibacterium silvisoli TaxID=3114758 RepID=A0ABU6K610_9RHOO|nr:methyltransferase domain-containing protein [Uliginosibacterium sp. H3]